MEGKSSITFLNKKGFYCSEEKQYPTESYIIKTSLTK